MKIVVNPADLSVDSSCQVFHKVRAIIENDRGEFIISNEGGSVSFLGENVRKMKITYLL